MNFIQAFNIHFRCKFHKKVGIKFLFCPYFYILVDEILNAFKNEQESEAGKNHTSCIVNIATILAIKLANRLAGEE